MTPDSESVLDRLDGLEREATAGPWATFVPFEGQMEYEARVVTKNLDLVVAECWKIEDAKLTVLSRNHLRALIEVARAAERYWAGDDDALLETRVALAPLITPSEQKEQT